MEFTCAIVSILLIPLVSIYNGFSGGAIAIAFFLCKNREFYFATW
jgi:hypothetical protein